jgi:hypothetical protein
MERSRRRKQATTTTTKQKGGKRWFQAESLTQGDGHRNRHADIDKKIPGLTKGGAFAQKGRKYDEQEEATTKHEGGFCFIAHLSTQICALTSQKEPKTDPSTSAHVLEEGDGALHVATANIEHANTLELRHGFLVIELCVCVVRLFLACCSFEKQARSGEPVRLSRESSVQFCSVRNNQQRRRACETVERVFSAMSS